MQRAVSLRHSSLRAAVAYSVRQFCMFASRSDSIKGRRFDSAELRVSLTPDEREQYRLRRAWSLNAMYIPRLRVIGSLIISCWLFLHIRYISGGTLELWAAGTALLFAHAFLSWGVLYRYYRFRARVDLSLVFLTTDLFVWTWLIYVTGAEQSWLFFLLSVRSADQTPTNFRRTFFFAHLGTLLYVAMLGYLFMSGREVDWGAAWSKAAMIYGFNLYLSLAARTTESIRRKMSAAIQMSRELIRDLEQKQRELSDALHRSAELERSLRQSQKLESLGHMATGIAHDFNNTMMAALPWADLIAEKGQNDPELRHAANRIRSTIRRAKEVTSHLLNFAQPKRPVVQRVELRHLVRQELQTLRLSLPEEIQLRVHDDVPSAVEIDPSQFGQVLTNLALNARDAMPNGGILTVSLRSAEEGEYNHEEVGPGTHVALDVADTGTGIDPTLLEKIFDPFFTTKDIGEGTGLGLPVVHRIVQEARGYLHVSSRVGEGTRFTIILPRSVAADVASPETMVEAERPSAPPDLEVLIVDDDQAVLEGLEMMLELIGMRPTGRESGQEALALLDSGFEPGLIILDLGMPGMSGSELHAEVRRRGIAIPIIVSSGYGERERIDALLRDPGTVYLQKPYEMRELEDVINTALAGGRA